MIRNRTPPFSAVPMQARPGLAPQGLGFLMLVSMVLLLALAGCSPPQGGTQSAEARADVATLDACRRRANEIYDRQNRAAIFAPNSDMNSPSSGAYVGGQTDRGLSARFAQEQLINECVRSAGLASERSAAAPATPETPAAAPKR